MLPTIVICGRPNVGKSTLFNRLTRSRDALVADFPGLTRDRQYGRGRAGEREFIVVDTGGFEPVAKTGIVAEMAKQTEQALAEADAIVFLVDARSGLTPQDRAIADRLRRARAPVYLSVNKAEGLNRDIAAAEFHGLALGEPHAISATHGEGVRGLIETIVAPLAKPQTTLQAQEDTHPRVAIIGRPNVGKSTLVNRLLGEERMIAFDEPGTTRDAIEINLERDGKRYTLVDTAGIRRRGKVFEAIEKFSVIKTLQAIEQANVIVLLLDATQDIAEQDAHIAGHVLEAGKAMVVAVNKWDALAADARAQAKRDLDRKLGFLDFADTHFVSARHGTGVNALFASIDKAFASAIAKLSTPRLTRVLHAAVTQHQPPRAGLFRPKLRYAHQGGSNPPTVIVHGSAVEGVSEDYRRYLAHTFRREFQLAGTPVRVEFRKGGNPFASRENKPLEGRALKRAQRERRHRRKTFG